MPDFSPALARKKLAFSASQTMKITMLPHFIRRAMLPLLAALALGACASNKTSEIFLGPVPYAMKVPADIAPRISTGPVEGPFRRDVKNAGGLAATTVYFNPGPGGENLPRTIFMTAYFFPAAKFDAAQNPNEPPRFGKEVVRSGGTVLGIAGPHDTIYDPATPSGRDVVRLHKSIYQPQTYRRLP
jgi:hypothetical protein